MFADSDMNLVVGDCLYYSNNSIGELDLDFNTEMYNKISTNSSTNINTEMCGPYKCRGLMCGQCVKDHGLPVYSYNISCVNSVDYK